MARGQNILLLGGRGSGKSAIVRALGGGTWPLGWNCAWNYAIQRDGLSWTSPSWILQACFCTSPRPDWPGPTAKTSHWPRIRRGPKPNFGATCDARELRDFCFFLILDCCDKLFARCLNLGRPAGSSSFSCWEGCGAGWYPSLAHGCPGVGPGTSQRRSFGPAGWHQVDSIPGLPPGGIGRTWRLAHTRSSRIVCHPRAAGNDSLRTDHGTSVPGANGHSRVVPTNRKSCNCSVVDAARHLLLFGRTWGASTFIACFATLDASSSSNSNGCTKTENFIARSLDVKIPPLAFTRHDQWLDRSGWPCFQQRRYSACHQLDFVWTWLCAVLLVFLRLTAISIYHQQLSWCPNEEENPQSEFVVKLDGDDIISGACRVPRRTPARPELVPAPRDFFASPAALMLGL